MGVEHGQQGQPDPGLRRRGGDTLHHLGRIDVGRAVGRVVQVVELGERGEAAFQHLHHGLGGDGFHVPGPEAGEKAVHHLPPGPEAVLARPAALGEARHGALEQVGVQIGQARDGAAAHAARRNPAARPGRRGAIAPFSISSPTSRVQPPPGSHASSSWSLAFRRLASLGHAARNAGRRRGPRC